jgi:DNA-binding LacI/PurR family transcriptional regulator
MKIAILKKDQIYEKLKKDILENKYSDGFQLPHEVDFARQLGVGKVTLRAALDRLEEEMLLVRLRGKGTFINNKRSSSPTQNVMIVASEEYLKLPNNPLLYLLPEFKHMSEQSGHGEIHVSTEQVKLSSQQDLYKVTHENNVKGIFLFGHIFTGKEPFLELLKSTGCPIILPHALQDDYLATGCAAITIKMADSWKNAIKYLIGLGHRRIATITQTSQYDKIMEMQQEELLHELASHGAVASGKYIKSVPYLKNEIEKAIDYWMALKEPPTTIMAVYPAFVPVIYSIIKQKGLAIPDDISIMATSRQRENLLLNPRLTSINADYRGIAAKAYKLLRDSSKWFPVKKGEKPPNLFHYYTLQKGESIKTICVQEKYDLCNIV